MPPRSTPNAPPAPAMAPQMLSALFRSRPSSKVTVRMESAAGDRMAAPSPWTARAITSQPELVASPQKREATVNSATPDDEDPAASQLVRHPPAQHQESPEEQRIGIQDPEQVHLREMQAPLDRGQRDVHDRDIQDDHELRHADDRQCEPLPRVGLHRSSSFAVARAHRVPIKDEGCDRRVLRLRSHVIRRIGQLRFDSFQGKNTSSQAHTRTAPGALRGGVRLPGRRADPVPPTGRRGRPSGR